MLYIANLIIVALEPSRTYVTDNGVCPGALKGGVRNWHNPKQNKVKFWASMVIIFNSSNTFMVGIVNNNIFRIIIVSNLILRSNIRGHINKILIHYVGHRNSFIDHFIVHCYP